MISPKRQAYLREGIINARKNQSEWLYMEGDEELKYVLHLLKTELPLGSLMADSAAAV
jgi:hypothetical protein